MSQQQAILDAIKEGIAFAKRVGAIDALEAVPHVSTAIAAVKAVEAVQSIIDNTQTRIREGQLVMSSSDQEKIRHLAAELSAENDRLAERIANS